LALHLPRSSAIVKARVVPSNLVLTTPGPSRNGEVHKHQIDSQGRWLYLSEYTAPTEGEWDNPFVLRVDQKASE
jgi:hypothetical protein